MAAANISVDLPMVFEGLPEGVERVEYRKPKSGEFVLKQGDRIDDGIEAYLSEIPSFVVVLKDGYEIVREPATGVYQINRQYDQPKHVTFQFEFNSKIERQNWQKWMRSCPVAMIRIGGENA
jgi:hypothetical protein